MSGPKVVDVRAIRAAQEREFRKLRHQIEKQFRKTEAMLEATENETLRRVFDSLTASLTRLDADREATALPRSLDAILDQANATLESALQLKSNIEEQRVASVAERLARQRSIEDAIAATVLRLETANLATMKANLLAKPDEFQLQIALDALATESQRQADADLQDVTDSLAGSHGTISVTDWLAAQPAEKSSADERLEQLAAKVCVLDGLGDASPWLTRIAEVRQIDDAARQRLQTDSLIIQLGEELDRRRGLERRAELLDALDAELAAFDTYADSLRQQIERARGDETADIAELQAEVAAWTEAEAKRIDRDASRAAILSVLQSMGYDVRESMATGWAEDGKVVVQAPGSQDYAVELSTVAGDRLKTQLVRFGEPGSSNAMQQQRDVEMETTWCKSHAEVLGALDRRGLETKVLTARPIGSTPIAVIPKTDERRSQIETTVKHQERHQQPKRP
ncbi:hypothetical protein Poly24_27020 [Rosistilla carotiformis]|uniref:Uncharacterized protein n=1 Tax=Rosistilla carotiformis TaxID=2528017 RepID=A0A518JTW7_9BACT|nr:hypothetical protein [Rosistilla carotiformis]QDV68989.1 hypothetical protein Poly24_27020 [Rosistilla carotiformis]